MEILLLCIYSFFVWLVFFKFKWLPWNFVSQVVVITIPIFGLTLLILMLNIVAPSSSDVRVINYVVAVNPRVVGMVTEVPIVPNRPIRKGDILFKLDPTPFQKELEALQAQLQQQQASLVTAYASQRSLTQQLRNATSNKASMSAKLNLAKLRVMQLKDLAESGAGNKFDYEQAQTDVANLEAGLNGAIASESQVQAKLDAKTAEGEQDEVATAKAEIANLQAKIANAQWNLEQTVYRAPANGTVVSLALRPGAMAVQLPLTPAMTFVEDEQWVMAIFSQNEVRKIKPNQEAEIIMKMYPGRVIKCKVDSIMWATAQGQLPIGVTSNTSGAAPIPPRSLAVRLITDRKDRDIFLASGALGSGAVYTDSLVEIQILRKILLRVSTKLDWLILKLH